MKKRTILLLVTAISCIGIGSVGSIYYFQKGQDLIKTTTNESYQVKHPEDQKHLEVTVSNSSHIILEPSDDQQFHINQTTYFNDRSLDWSITEENQGTNLTISKKAADRPKNFIFFNLWDEQFDSVIISIPKDYQEIVLNIGDSSIDIHDLKTKKITASLTSGNLSVTSLLTDELLLKNKYGNVSLNDSHAEKKLSIHSQYGQTDLSAITTDELAIQSENGDVYLNQITGESKITMGNGNLHVQNHQGLFESTSKNGDVTWNSPTLEKNISIKTGSGNINLNVAKIAKNVSIKSTTTLGNSQILDDDRSSFQTNADGPQIQLESKYGNITVDDDYEDYEDFDN